MSFQRTALSPMWLKLGASGDVKRPKKGHWVPITKTMAKMLAYLAGGGEPLEAIGRVVMCLDFHCRRILSASVASRLASGGQSGCIYSRLGRG